MGSEAKEGTPAEESSSSSSHGLDSQGEQVLPQPPEEQAVPQPPEEQGLPPPPEESAEEKQREGEKQTAASASASSSSGSSSSAASAPAPAPPERKVSSEESAAIIESLRARLLSERNSSRAAKQQALQLTRKVKELEKSLEAEIQHRKRCEEVIQELLLKLGEAGVATQNPNSASGDRRQRDEQDEDEEVDDEEEEEEQTLSSSSKSSKANWTIKRRRRHHHQSDNNSEADAAEQQSPSESPVSDSSLLSKRVGRSCRTLRRKETWELGGVDDQVKSSWSKVGEDVMELSKLREATGSGSGWVGRVMDMFETRNEGSSSSSGEQPEMDQQQQEEQQQQQQQPETSPESSSNGSSNSSVGMEVSAANSKCSELSAVNTIDGAPEQDQGDGLQQDAAAATNSARGSDDSSEATEARTAEAANASRELLGSSGQMLSVPTESAAHGSHEGENQRSFQTGLCDKAVERLPPSSSSSPSGKEENAATVSRSRGSNDVEDILKALRIAKQQVLAAAAGNHAGAGAAELKRSLTHGRVTDFQPRFESGTGGFVVTRPLAQFIPHF